MGMSLLSLLQDSLHTVDDAYVDRSVQGASQLTHYQFERQGYFCVDYDSTPDKVNNVLSSSCILLVYCLLVLVYS